jgi:hypothetical protein
MKYVKTFENFEYNDSVNEGLFDLFRSGRDKIKKALDAVLNSEKAKEVVQKFYESLPDKSKKAAEELVKKTGNKTDEQLEYQLLAEAEQVTGKKGAEVEELNKELETEKLDDNYKFRSDAMINEELNFRLMFDKFLTKISTIVGSLGILGSALVFFTTAVGYTGTIFATLWPIVTGILGYFAPVIALVVIIISIILLVRRLVIFVTRHPATGERCNSYQQWKEAQEFRDYYDEKTDRYVFPSMPDKSFHMSELVGAKSGPDETYVDFWRAKFDKGEWDGKDKLGNLLPAYAKKESFRNKMKSFRRF